MLDGLLRRSGFFSKCKSLIKLTRTRIDVVMRKRNATQKFLRKDIADLLANGLEFNAYGRTEGLIAELILSSCYDFIDHVCEIILKHLPVLQKLRECPKECREAVASIMFAAARFSDLPELRELRDVFQERYGSTLEYYVNQKLVENITPKPPSMDQKVQLMQEIALEFSVWWDDRGFEERMPNSIVKQNNEQSRGTLHAAENGVRTPCPEATAVKNNDATYESKERDELKHNASKVQELATDRNKLPSYREETTHKKEDHDIPFRRGLKTDIHDCQENSTLEAVQVGTSSRGKSFEGLNNKHELESQCHREDNLPVRNLTNTLSRQKPDQLPVKNRTNLQSASEVGKDIQVRSMRKRQEEVTDGSKSNFRSFNAFPPPYVKQRKSKHKADSDSTHADLDPSARSKVPPDSPDHQDEPTVADGQGRFTEIYYKDSSASRRRSHRRKHSRPLSTQDDKANGDVAFEEERVVRRVSTSRRKHESRKGLQILFDDEEERMIDKMLLHYSKKPSPGDHGEPTGSSIRETTNASKSPCHHDDLVPTTSRSMSLPPRQAPQPEPQKVFSRASSFQQGTTAKHVHPKLPDYDDLAARFAALRASKG